MPEDFFVAAADHLLLPQIAARRPACCRSPHRKKLSRRISAMKERMPGHTAPANENGPEANAVKQRFSRHIAAQNKQKRLQNNAVRI